MSLFIALLVCAASAMAQTLPLVHRSPVPSLPPPETYFFDGTPDGFAAALDDYATYQPRSPETLFLVAELQHDALIKDHYIGKLVSEVHRVDINFANDAFALTTFYNTRQTKRHVVFDFV
jgi:hypothetical protein